jgi:hypothetical protein
MVNIARTLFGLDKKKEAVKEEILDEPKPEPEMSEELRYNVEMSQKRIDSLGDEEE